MVRSLQLVKVWLYLEEDNKVEQEILWIATNLITPRSSLHIVFSCIPTEFGPTGNTGNSIRRPQKPSSVTKHEVIRMTCRGKSFKTQTYRRGMDVRAHSVSCLYMSASNIRVSDCRVTSAFYSVRPVGGFYWTRERTWKGNKKAQQSWQTSALSMHLPLAR